MRAAVRHHALERCEYCWMPETGDEWPFHLEHIVARQHGGVDEPGNLCWSCSRCNLYKGPNLTSIDPMTGSRADLFHPRKQIWADHFSITDAQIVGLTPTGRATVRLLRMNDNRRVALRRELIEQGLFPLPSQ